MPFIELQKAIYSTLQTLNIPIYDHIPQDTLTFPYIFIGDDVFIDSPLKDLSHYSCYSNIHIFSNAIGNKEVKEIMTQVVDLIKSMQLSNGWKITFVRLANTHILGDSRPDVVHAMLQFYFEISKIKE